MDPDPVLPEERDVLALSPYQPIPYIARKLGIPEQTIYSWIRRRQVQIVRIDKMILACRKDVDELRGACSWPDPSSRA